MPRLRVHLLALTGFTMIVAVMVGQPVLPLYLKERGLPAFQVGLISGLISLSLVVTELCATAVSARIGRRRAFIIGTVGGALAQLWFTFAETRPEWYVSRLLFGGFRGLLWPILFAEVAASSPDGRRGAAFSTFWAYFGLGLLVAPWLGGVVGDVAGLRAPLLLSALLALVPLALTWNIGPQRDTAVSTVSALVNLGGNRAVATVWLLTILNTMMMGLGGTFLPIYASAQGLSPSQIGLLFSAGAAAFTAGQLPARWLIGRYQSATLLIAAYLIRSMATGAVMVTHTFAGLLALNLIAGGFGAFLPTILTSTLAGTVRQQDLVVTMGAYNASADLGFFIGPLIGGVAAGYGAGVPFALMLPLGVLAVPLIRLGLRGRLAAASGDAEEEQPARPRETATSGGP